jgi:signal transduction histidine kinase
MPMPPEKPNVPAVETDWPSPRVRWVLLATFAALLALILIAGLAASRTLREMHQQEENARQALAQRGQMLTGLFVSVEVYNQDVGRFVGSPGAKPDPLIRHNLEEAAKDLNWRLSTYPGGRQKQEDAFLQQLDELCQRHRELYQAAVAGTLAHDLMAGEVVTMRSQILDWSQQLNTWNDRRLRASDAELLSQFGNLQSNLTTSLSIALGAGLLLVIASMAYILRLERQTRNRYQELAQSRHELERLSSRLVDAQEEERRSISRELHDEVGQSLGALLVDLGRLSTNLPSNSSEIRERIDQMKSLTERTVGTVRDIALLLRPSMLDDLGLVAALEWQGREVSRRSPMEVAVESSNVSDDLPDEYKICVYRLVQEALNNAVRHSQARNAKVRVTGGANGIEIEVSDDGRGFDPQRTRGLGILGMEERVRRLGGSLAVRSSPGQGTVVRAELPTPVHAGTSV